jgi:hypothetical protein
VTDTLNTSGMTFKLKGSCHGWKPRHGQTEDHCSKRQHAFKRGHNFGWKAFLDLHPDWSCISLESRRNSGTEVKPTHLGRMRDVLIFSVLYHGICFTTEEKGTENLNQSSQKVPVEQYSECWYGHLLTGSHDMNVDTGLPWDASGNLDQHSVRVDICPAAKLRDSTN